MAKTQNKFNSKIRCWFFFQQSLLENYWNASNSPVKNLDFSIIDAYFDRKEQFFRNKAMQVFYLVVPKLDQSFNQYQPTNFTF